PAGVLRQATKHVRLCRRWRCGMLGERGGCVAHGKTSGSGGDAQEFAADDGAFGHFGAAGGGPEAGGFLRVGLASLRGFVDASCQICHTSLLSKIGRFLQEKDGGLVWADRG
ncbi:MAG: hypothetical protein LUO89_00175, partial [Methanothrix sp.]|nr:hypothetical protein [Methanothrix sp.]